MLTNKDKFKTKVTSNSHQPNVKNKPNTKKLLATFELKIKKPNKKLKLDLIKKFA